MSAQLSYSIKQAVAYVGGIFAQFNKEISSFSVEPSAGIGFGVAVGRGTDAERQCDLAGAGNFIGITVRSLDREGAINTGAIQYSENETAAILRSGYIWAACPAGCNPGDSVKYTDDTGVLDSGAAGAGETQLDGATWETVTTAGELGVIRLTSDDITAGS